MSDLPVPVHSLRLKVPALEWASEAASGEMDDLAWVDSTIDSSSKPFAVVNTADGWKYRHRPYAYFLPRSMALAASNAQQNGEPTVMEGILLLFARTEWLIASRPYYWSPLSPVSELLGILSEAFGVGAEIHENQREVLARLVARLPTWYPHRGTISRARQLLEETVGEKLEIQTAHIDTDGPNPLLPAISDEIFACRSAEWWARRKEKGSNMHYRIGNGMLKFQPEEGGGYPLIREDIMIGWREGRKFPLKLLRLLPIWTTIRIVLIPRAQQ
jgi:hypothetical protein